MDLNIKNIKTTELSSRELNEISQIFKSSFQITVKPDFLYQKYISNPFGFSFHSIVKNSKEDLVGIYTFSPKIFMLNNRKINALQSLDTCFPQRGLVNPFLIKKIVKELLKFVKNEISDLKFVYGFPNSKYEKLSKYFLNWNYVLTLYSYVEVFPLIKVLYLSFFRNFKYKKILRLSPKQEEIKTRLKSFFHSNLEISNKNEFTLWFTKNPFYLQIFNINLAQKESIFKKANIFKNAFFLSRLFIPSISSSTKKPSWGINRYMPKFNLYLIALNDDFDIRKLYLDVSFLWNDVP